MNASTRSHYRLADKAVWRVGYGAIQLAGDGVFGPPRDRTEAIAVLRAAVDAGVDHIDTAQYYGPGVVNELTREALHPYPDDLALVVDVAAAAAHDASAARIALAWLLAVAPNVLLIPGTRTRAHLVENLAAECVWLDDREIALLNQEFS